MLTRIMLFHENLQMDFFSKFAQISKNVNKLGSGVFVKTFYVSLFFFWPFFNTLVWLILILFRYFKYVSRVFRADSTKELHKKAKRIMQIHLYVFNSRLVSVVELYFRQGHTTIWPWFLGIGFFCLEGREGTSWVVGICFYMCIVVWPEWWLRSHR